MNDDRLDRLTENVRYLMDRTEIQDVVAAHARGCDRHDAGLLCSTYHPDGVDEHGAAVNPGPDYAAWANAAHAAGSRNHLHNVTTHRCEIDGDTAHAESYVLVAMLTPDGTTASVLNGRYLDRLERRDGSWRIALRRSTVELAFTADARLLSSPYFIRQGYPSGTRDRADPSYQRPLTLDRR